MFFILINPHRISSSKHNHSKPGTASRGSHYAASQPDPAAVINRDFTERGINKARWQGGREALLEHISTLVRGARGLPCFRARQILPPAAPVCSLLQPSATTLRQCWVQTQRGSQESWLSTHRSLHSLVCSRWQSPGLCFHRAVLILPLSAGTRNCSRLGWLQGVHTHGPLQVPALGGERRIVAHSTPVWGKTLCPADLGGLGPASMLKTT